MSATKGNNKVIIRLNNYCFNLSLRDRGVKSTQPLLINEDLEIEKIIDIETSEEYKNEIFLKLCFEYQGQVLEKLNNIIKGFNS